MLMKRGERRVLFRFFHFGSKSHDLISFFSLVLDNVYEGYRAD